MLVILLAIAVVCATYLFVATYNHLNYWNKRGVLCEKPHFIYGNLSELEHTKNLSTIHNDFYKKFKRKTPYIGFFFHLKPSLVIFDLDVAKDVLIKDFSNFTSKFRYLNEHHDPMTATLLNLEGTKWQNLRKDLTVAFTPSKIKSSIKRVQEESQILVEYLEAIQDIDNVIDIRELVVRHITNIMCRFCLEIESKDFKKDVFYEKALEILGSSTNFYNRMSRSLIASFPRLFTKLGIKIISKDMDNFLINTVDNVLKDRSEDKVDFLSVFLKMRDVTVKKISAQVYSFFEASLITTSTTICTALYELALNEDVQDKLRKEILEYLDENQGVCDYASIKHCKYLEKVINETLRKYPIATQLSRVCESDYTIKKWNLKIEKGVLIIIPTSAINMDPEIFPNPEVFNPERFTPENIESRHSMAFLPFGEGGRSCIGREFGKIMLKLALIELLRHFKFSASPKTDIPLKLEHTQVNLPDGKIFLRVEKLY
ncbi:hypothetical protein ACFFRR_001885 [Megaselia abdita]